jgi:hypothetical protein
MPVGMEGMADVVGRGLASIHDVTVTVAPVGDLYSYVNTEQQNHGRAYVDEERSGWASVISSC